MAKKKSAGTRQRKKASSPSDEHDGVVASTMNSAPDADGGLPVEARPTKPPKSPTVNSHDLDQEPVSGSNPELPVKTNPEQSRPESHPDDLTEDAVVAVEDGVLLAEDLELPPPLTVVAPPLPAMRSQPMESAASAASSSSCTSTSGLPRARSFVMSDNATLFQAMPTNKTEVVEVVAEQSWLITKLTVQLLWALRNSHKWVLMAWRLVGFVVCLLPALIRMAHYWAFDPYVHKNLIYGLNARNLLDVYTVPSDKIAKPSHQQLHPRYQQQQQRNATVPPSDPQQALGADSVVELKRPVVVFLSGGAWIIGYKGWGALMGKALSAFGIVVVMPDYRNFPQGIIPDMVDDASMAMQWVFDHIHHFGGDPDNVTLVGQSAGAHIATCALLEMVEKRKQWIDGMQGGGHGSASMGVSSPSAMSNCSVFSNTSIEMGAMLPQTPTWELRQIRNFIGISGPYNMENSIETFHRHGFDRSVVDRIMDHRISYFSPALRLFGYSEHGHAVDLLHDFPPTYLYHGTADSTVSWKSSEQLAQAMQSCGLRFESQFFQDKTHTDIIIEDPISGSGDVLLAQIVEVIKKRSPRDANGHTVFQFAAEFTSPRQYYPRLLVKLARFVNPF